MSLWMEKLKKAQIELAALRHEAIPFGPAGQSSPHRHMMRYKARN
jgi:hypothetical protein